MINMKTIKQLVSLSEKGEKIMEGISIVSDNTIKEVNILELLEKLDTREIPIDKNIIVSGFLSKYAPIYEPDTYYNQAYKISDVKEEGIDEYGQYFTLRDLIVEPVSPPVTRVDIQSGLNIAYLYIRGAEKPFILNTSKDEEGLKVENENKYIPILLEQKDFINLTEREVKIKCSINVINYKEVSKLLGFRNEEFRELYSLFYDMYNENVDCITLNLEDIIEVEDIKLDTLEIIYGVEYNCIPKKLDEKNLKNYIINNINKIINTDSGFKLNNRELDGRKIKAFLVKEDIVVNINESKVGFYCKIDMKNRNNMRMKKRELKKFIDKFKYSMKNELDYEISFISDCKDIDKKIF
ncbi:Uncharacterised protein [[Clostridium] sordellii]|uniref:hypothetical protein n=1 Tax=Paraclostridium sordellii TaxID=1505 RepID=UPI0005E27E25|nr:hypothetical protein [Paeniclostridium sordellii]CEP45782.1 Uncharacterised protein [[Clostridium] sordellii] [Paeniclostridium sordellii]